MTNKTNRDVKKVCSTTRLGVYMQTLFKWNVQKDHVSLKFLIACWIWQCWLFILKYTHTLRLVVSSFSLRTFVYIPCKSSISIDSNFFVYFHFTPLLNFVSHLRMIIRNNVRGTLRSRANSSSDRQSQKFIISLTVCQTSSKGICERLSADD